MTERKCFTREAHQLLRSGALFNQNLPQSEVSIINAVPVVRHAKHIGGIKIMSRIVIGADAVKEEDSGSAPEGGDKAIIMQKRKVQQTDSEALDDDPQRAAQYSDDEDDTLQFASSAVATFTVPLVTKDERETLALINRHFVGGGNNALATPNLPSDTDGGTPRSNVTTLAVSPGGSGNQNASNNVTTFAAPRVAVSGTEKQSEDDLLPNLNSLLSAVRTIKDVSQVSTTGKSKLSASAPSFKPKFSPTYDVATQQFIAHCDGVAKVVDPNWVDPAWKEIAKGIPPLPQGSEAKSTDGNDNQKQKETDQKGLFAGGKRRDDKRNERNPDSEKDRQKLDEDAQKCLPTPKIGNSNVIVAEQTHRIHDDDDDDNEPDVFIDELPPTALMGVAITAETLEAAFQGASNAPRPFIEDEDEDDEKPKVERQDLLLPEDATVSQAPTDPPTSSSAEVRRDFLDDFINASSETTCLENKISTWETPHEADHQATTQDDTLIPPLATEEFADLHESLSPSTNEGGAL